MIDFCLSGSRTFCAECMDLLRDLVLSAERSIGQYLADLELALGKWFIDPKERIHRHFVESRIELLDFWKDIPRFGFKNLLFRHINVSMIIVGFSGDIPGRKGNFPNG